MTRAQLMELTADRCTSSRKLGVGEHGLHQVLAVVEGALDGDVVHVGGHDGGHLATLQRRGAFVGVQHDDVDRIAVAAGLDGGRAGVARGRGDDGDAFARRASS